MISPYEIYNNHIGVRLSFLITDEDKANNQSIGLIGYNGYKSKCNRNKSFRLKEGRGLGNEALISWEAMPREWQIAFIEKFGDPKTAKNPLAQYYSLNGEAKRFYDNYRFDDGSYLKPDQIEKYTVNASVLLALEKLKHARETSRKMRGGSSKNVWASLIRDVISFNDTLKSEHGVRHTLPESDKLKQKFNQFRKVSFACLVDGRNRNNNRQQVTPIMLSLWKDIYAGQKNHKPNHLDVYTTYQGFLTGQAEIINNNTGELYNRHDEDFKQVSEKTVYNYQTAWENRIVTHSKRSGNRQEFTGEYRPYHKLKQPEFAGSIISIDDRQPPFKYGSGGGNRMWFYMGVDLGSEAITCWVHGLTKEGIITEFYEQLVRNYANWNLNLPYELECESSLNSSFKDTFLAPGNMFQEVRIESNNARGKRIERIFRDVRYMWERQYEGFRARPHARDEANQPGADKEIFLTKQQIVELEHKIIYMWNNTLHSNQELHPGMTRWQVFLNKQHPQVPPTNWAGIIPHLGKATKTSMKAGRITLQGKHRMVGFDGQVALGDKLIGVMRRIEGEDVVVRWMENDNGDVLKALVYTQDGQLVCELLGDFSYHKAKLEQGEADLINREINSAYTATVDGYIRTNAREIDSVTIVKKPFQIPEGEVFTMPGMEQYDPSEFDAVVLPQIDEEEQYDLNPIEKSFKTSTASRF